MSDVRVRRHTDGRIAITMSTPNLRDENGPLWRVFDAAGHTLPWHADELVHRDGWSEFLVTELPEPDGWADAVGDNGEDARTPYWETRHSTYTAWNEGVEDDWGLNEGASVELVRVDALKMLAAVAAHERFRAEVAS